MALDNSQANQLGKLNETASQTAGPFLHIGMYPSAAGLPIRTQEQPNVLVTAGVKGERIRLEGVVYDGQGAPVKDAQIEIWQADSQGKYNHPDDPQDLTPDPGLCGFGRAVADFDSGLWWFETVKPGAVPGPRGAKMAPHISLLIFARGINIHLHSRVYFEDEAEANAQDALLQRVDPAERRDTLLARRREEEGQVVYRFDIHLQGPQETVFLDI
ncbi:protocatechuate 3,4-dioxygenase subunit alpha [Rhodovibrionaceae bacterium A322]